MKEYFYSIYGVDFKLTTDSLTICLAANTFLGSFKQETLNGSIALETLIKKVNNRTEIPLNNSSCIQVLFQSQKFTEDKLCSAWRYQVYRNSERSVVDFSDLGLLEIDYKRRRVEGYFIESGAINPNDGINFFRLAFIELLKIEKLYVIHAAALEKAGRGLLIPGYSGQGKTSCCISLIRGGYSCLSDDHPLLIEDKKGLKLLPFLTKIDVTEKTIEFFPELRDAKDCIYQGFEKRYFYLEDIYPNAQANSCEPALIIFPQIVNSPKSHLELLPKSKAIEEFLPHSILVWDKNIAKQQFQICSQLVNKAACYRLHLGRNILELPQVIEPLINGK